MALDDLNPRQWVMDVFKAKQVRKGGIVRRAKKDVLRQASEGELKAVVKELGFHLVESGNQYIVICNPGIFRLVC